MRHQIAYVLFCLLLREFALSKAFSRCPGKKLFFFEVWEYTSIVYVSTPFFFRDRDDRQSGSV